MLKFLSEHLADKEGGYLRDREEAKSGILLATPLLAANNPTESVVPLFLRNSRTNAAVGRGELEAGAACSCESAQTLSRPRARPRGRRARAPAGWREGALEAPSYFLEWGRENGKRLERSTLRTGGLFRTLRRSIHEVSPLLTEIWSPGARRHPPRSRRWPPRRSPRPPERGSMERGSMERAGAGNSRGLSWRSPSGERSPAFLLPRPGGGVRHRDGLAARVGGGAAAANCSRTAAGGKHGRRRPLLRSHPVSREPPRAPARGPRPLAVLAFLHTPPGPPGPQAFPALLLPLSKLCCEPAAVRLPRYLRGDFSSDSPFTHRHARERARALARWATPFSPALLTHTLTIL